MPSRRGKFMDVFRPVACPMSCVGGECGVRGIRPKGPQQQQHHWQPSSRAAGTTDPVVSGAREVLAELVEGRRHDAVGRVECLLDACSGRGGVATSLRSGEAAAAETLRRLTVAVVNVDINVEHALVHPAGGVGRKESSRSARLVRPRHASASSAHLSSSRMPRTQSLT